MSEHDGSTTETAPDGDETTERAAEATDDGDPVDGGGARDADGPGDALAVDGVARSFGDVSVLADVSFTADRGTVACLVGPNGSGKTTLLRVVAGLLAPDAGSVLLPDGGDRAVGYLAQTPAFRPQFTLAETLGFYGDLAGVDVDPDGVLERVGLEAVADRRVGALSGGMTRLFGIAVATIGDPPVLVLDEPSSGLDPTMTEHVGSVVRDLADEGRTVLLATHELGTVDRVGDTVLVLDDGVIQTAAAPDALRRETGSETLTHAVNQFVHGGAGDLTVRAGTWEGADE
ncbi:ABC transporter ATP-binding protein [Halosimplex litoreum]|uniref:ABC transporter ATP-binding protein n=1 Tax=Halosimplex litoreum TaxID=1198301 RepID=A0A7T3FXM6_9EURY|nr:ABC transporter ATP-binding protein [Halosimplex litoreum]QPV62615.1 ABC transporter ATP-binding protein [Halosimplex litoreum]